MSLKLSLIQSSVQQNHRLIIPGSSLKGVVRSSMKQLQEVVCAKLMQEKEKFLIITVNANRHQIFVQLASYLEQ